MLFSLEKDQQYTETLIDRSGLLVSALPLNPTVREKCAAEAARFICAVPRELPNNVLLPDDYLKRKIYTKDDFVLWDATAKKISPVSVNTKEAIDARDVQIKNSTLFFVNNYGGKLYKLEISN